MSDLQAQTEQYLHDVLGIAMTGISWDEERRLPLFLRERYVFFLGNLLDCPCLFMVDKGENEEAPAVVGRHMGQIRAKCQEPVVYVRGQITAYNRKRLVEHRISFIVPGNQMYLPCLGIDFREHFRKPRPPRIRLRPASQVVLLHALLEDVENLGPTAMAERLGYTAMTMSRAFDELETAGLIVPKATGRGKVRNLRLAASKPEIWRLAQPVLESPVRAVHVVHLPDSKDLPGPQAGLTALAHYSMLAEPENRTVALSREEWKALQQGGETSQAIDGEPDAVRVEEWRYAPAFFASDGRVDRLSLCLSLRGMKDERIQKALEEMMGEMPW